MGANLETRHVVLEDLETIFNRLSAFLDLHCTLHEVSETP